MNQELILEKYTSEPIIIKINDDNMLECDGVTVADNIVSFDAVTDTAGSVHGVLLNGDGQIIYFRLANGFPISKSIASGISQQSLKHLSITEEDGILHILIIKTEKNFTVHHYRTQGNTWIRSYPKNMDLSTVYIDSCPCSAGKFALLVKNNGKELLFIESLGRLQQIQHAQLPLNYTDISMSYYNGNIEILSDMPYGSGVQSSTLVTLDTPKQNNSFVIKEINNNMEDNMANGSIINSKYISQLESNTSEIEIIKQQLEELRETINSINKMLENAEKHYKYITYCRDTVKQHDTQINQANIKIQELTNRFNGFTKQQR